MTGGGGGGPSDFFESEIFIKSDFLGSIKDAGIILGREEKRRDFLCCEKGPRDFFGYAIKSSDFFG